MMNTTESLYVSTCPCDMHPFLPHLDVAGDGELELQQDRLVVRLAHLIQRYRHVKDIGRG